MCPPSKYATSSLHALTATTAHVHSACDWSFVSASILVSPWVVPVVLCWVAESAFLKWKKGRSFHLISYLVHNWVLISLLQWQSTLLFLKAAAALSMVPQ
jgi:hypothetical protein